MMVVVVEEEEEEEETLLFLQKGLAVVMVLVMIKGSWYLPNRRCPSPTDGEGDGEDTEEREKMGLWVDI